MYDPIELSNKISSQVILGNKKKYYRFRPTRFYGGIATADTVGCNLRCVFCWSSKSVWNSEGCGDFYSPEEIADKLDDIALQHGYVQMRVSGGEPTIGKQHLIKVLENVNPSWKFILETNGILLGYDNNFVSELSDFKNLHVRVCLKGADEKEFGLVTNALNGFGYQLKALELLRKHGISFHVAVVSLKHDLSFLVDFLSSIDCDDIMLEQEEIVLYPAVKKRLEKMGLLSHFSD